MVKITERQFEILVLKIAGKSDKEISSDLNISVKTVKYHSGGLYRALGGKAQTAGELIKIFGSFEIHTVWVPNPNAPKITVIKNRTGKFDTIKAIQANKIKREIFMETL